MVGIAVDEVKRTLDLAVFEFLALGLVTVEVILVLALSLVKPCVNKISEVKFRLVLELALVGHTVVELVVAETNIVI